MTITGLDPETEKEVALAALGMVMRVVVQSALEAGLDVTDVGSVFDAAKAELMANAPANLEQAVDPDPAG